MAIKYKCEQCEREFRRGALVKIYGELLCRKCMLEDYPIRPIKVASGPLKTPRKGIGAMK